MRPDNEENLPKRFLHQGIAGFTALAFLLTQLAFPLPTFAMRNQAPSENEVQTGLEERLDAEVELPSLNTLFRQALSVPSLVEGTIQDVDPDPEGAPPQGSFWAWKDQVNGVSSTRSITVPGAHSRQSGRTVPPIGMTSLQVSPVRPTPEPGTLKEATAGLEEGVPLNLKRLDELERQVLAEIDQSKYSGAPTFQERIARYERFVTTQTKRYGITVSQRSAEGIWEFNGKMLRNILRRFLEIARLLREGAIRTAFYSGRDMLFRISYWVLQSTVPKVVPSFDKEGNFKKIVYYPRGQIYPTVLLSWSGLHLLTGRGFSLEEIEATFLYAVPATIWWWWYLRFRGLGEGHEWTHIYQMGILERVLQELQVSLPSDKWMARIPIGAFEQSLPMKDHREPPDREQLKDIVRDLFGEIRRLAADESEQPTQETPSAGPAIPPTTPAAGMEEVSRQSLERSIVLADKYWVGQPSVPGDPDLGHFGMQGFRGQVLQSHINVVMQDLTPLPFQLVQRESDTTGLEESIRELLAQVRLRFGEDKEIVNAIEAVDRKLQQIPTGLIEEVERWPTLVYAKDFLIAMLQDVRTPTVFFRRAILELPGQIEAAVEEIPKSRVLPGSSIRVLWAVPPKNPEADLAFLGAVLEQLRISAPDFYTLVTEFIRVIRLGRGLMVSERGAVGSSPSFRPYWVSLKWSFLPKDYQGNPDYFTGVLVQEADHHRFRRRWPDRDELILDSEFAVELDPDLSLAQSTDSYEHLAEIDGYLANDEAWLQLAKKVKNQPSRQDKVLSWVAEDLEKIAAEIDYFERFIGQKKLTKDGEELVRAQRERQKLVALFGEVAAGLEELTDTEVERVIYLLQGNPDERFEGLTQILAWINSYPQPPAAIFRKKDPLGEALLTGLFYDELQVPYPDTVGSIDEGLYQALQAAYPGERIPTQSMLTVFAFFHQPQEIREASVQAFVSARQRWGDIFDAIISKQSERVRRYFLWLWDQWGPGELRQGAKLFAYGVTLTDSQRDLIQSLPSSDIRDISWLGHRAVEVVLPSSSHWRKLKDILEELGLPPGRTALQLTSSAWLDDRVKWGTALVLLARDELAAWRPSAFRAEAGASNLPKIVGPIVAGATGGPLEKRTDRLIGHLGHPDELETFFLLDWAQVQLQKEETGVLLSKAEKYAADTYRRLSETLSRIGEDRQVSLEQVKAFLQERYRQGAPPLIDQDLETVQILFDKKESISALVALDLPWKLPLNQPNTHDRYEPDSQKNAEVWARLLILETAKWAYPDLRRDATQELKTLLQNLRGAYRRPESEAGLEELERFAERHQETLELLWISRRIGEAIAPSDYFEELPVLMRRAGFQEGKLWWIPKGPVVPEVFQEGPGLKVFIQPEWQDEIRAQLRFSENLWLEEVTNPETQGALLIGDAGFRKRVEKQLGPLKQFFLQIGPKSAGQVNVNLLAQLLTRRLLQAGRIFHLDLEEFIGEGFQVEEGTAIAA